MARNTGHNYRIGAVSERCQIYDPIADSYDKFDSTTGEYLGTKGDGEPFKGVTLRCPPPAGDPTYMLLALCQMFLGNR